MGTTRFMRFFRAAADLDVDKNDLKRFDEFVDNKIYDMFLLGRNSASSNGRDIIRWMDLPITKGLQESIHKFEKLNEEIELEPLLERITAWPPPDLTFDDQVRERIPLIAGGLSYALAQTFKIVDPELKNPGTEHWDRNFRIFDQLL